MMTEDDDDYGFLMAMMTRSSANLNFQKSAKAYYRPEDCWVRHQSFVQGQKESSRANDPSSSCLQSFFFPNPRPTALPKHPAYPVSIRGLSALAEAAPVPGVARLELRVAMISANAKPRNFMLFILHCS